ncbi:MAG TPA: hypothetical protein VJB14_14950, partial [Planctomycetota bacterium]|nr:hypothetical protein [Planctomycetota bacterium]
MSEPLIARWLEDRDGLTEAEAAELLGLLRSDPSLAARVREQLILDDALSRRLALDRADFSGQVAQRLRTAGDGDAFLESTLRGARRGERSSWRSWLLEAAAALLLVASLAFFLFRREPGAFPAVSAGGFRGEYFAGREFRGVPVVR